MKETGDSSSVRSMGQTLCPSPPNGVVVGGASKRVLQVHLLGWLCAIPARVSQRYLLSRPEGGQVANLAVGGPPGGKTWGTQ